MYYLFYLYDLIIWATALALILCDAQDEKKLKLSSAGEYDWLVWKTAEKNGFWRPETFWYLWENETETNTRGSVLMVTWAKIKLEHL